MRHQLKNFLQLQVNVEEVNFCVITNNCIIIIITMANVIIIQTPHTTQKNCFAANFAVRAVNVCEFHELMQYNCIEACDSCLQLILTPVSAATEALQRRLTIDEASA